MKQRRVALVAAILIFVVVVGSCLFLLSRLLDPYRLPPSDWLIFQENFISPEGRVMDTGNGKVTHSEGQGYGMFIAVAYGDRRTFDLIWNWTKKNLQTRPNDKLLSWLWKPGEKEGGAVADVNNATDGDLLVAWALQRAFERWQDYDYQKAAAQILVDLAKVDVLESNRGVVFLPGTEGFVKENGITLNPSYYIFPAFEALGKAFPGGPWPDLQKNGVALVLEARFGKWALPPDWALLKDEVTISPDFPPLFGYNAARVPLNIAWADPKSEALKPFAAFWKQFRDPAKIPATVNLQDNSFGTDPAIPGVRCIAAFTIACVENRRLTVRALPRVTRDEAYFSASLKILTKIAIRDVSAPK